MSKSFREAVQDVLDYLTDASTNVKTNKLDIFKEALKFTSEHPRYRDVKKMIHEEIMDFCDVEGYTVEFKLNGQYTDYYINTEAATEEAKVTSRNRVYISKSIVCDAGFNPGDKLIVERGVDADTGDTFYDIKRFDGTIIPGMSLVAVEKDGGVRISVKNDFNGTVPWISADAGHIEVY